MRIALLLLALLLPASSLAAESVTFSFAPLRSGESITAREATAMKLDVSMYAGDTVMGTMNAENVSTKELTAKLGKWTPKKRVATLRYGQVNEVEGKGMGGAMDNSETSSPVAHQTYAVKLGKGGEVSIINTTGGDVTEAERTAILEDWNDLQRTEGDEFSSALVGKTMAVGDTMDADSSVVQSFVDAMGNDDDMTIKDASLVLSEVRTVGGERCAVFSLSLDIAGDDDEVALQMVVSGEVVVGIKTLRAHEVTLAGPILLSASSVNDGVAMRMDGKGTMSLTLGSSYGK